MSEHTKRMLIAMRADRRLQVQSSGLARVVTRPVKLRSQSRRHYKMQCWSLIAPAAWCACLEGHRQMHHG